MLVLDSSLVFIFQIGLSVPRFILQLSLFLFIALILFTDQAKALDVQNVRFGVHPDKTRMVIELNQKSDFRAFMLPKNADKPYRLVVDLPEFNWKAGAIPKPRGTNVLDVRSGSLKPGIKRLVIELAQPARIKTAFLLLKTSGKPYRLVIDFKIISASQFQTEKRHILGTLNVDSADLNLLIARQTADTIQSAQQPASVSAKNIILPPRKPRPPKNFAAGAPTPAKPKTPLRKPLIVIDAGHGGADPGAIGASRSYEKHVTLAAAIELKKQLEATGHYRAALTRSNDKYLKLYKRVSIARAKKADLFISLHADSIGKSNVRGASIYTLSNKSSDAQTAKLAARENQADLIAGVDLSHEDKDVANILIDLAMRDTMNQSKFFANTVVTKMRSRGLRILEKPHRFAGFAVLKAPDIPSVLVEIGFMSNKKEAKLLKTKEYQRKIASALTDSIDTYFTKVRKNSIE